MDLNLIKKLIKVVESSDITEFSVEEGDLKLKISKQKEFISAPAAAPQTIALPAGVPAAAPSPAVNAQETTEAKSNLHEIKSPIVGTFYRAPAPDADSYVKVGDKITSGTVLCIIEAMKLMNEIEADVNGKIVKILVENGTPVEYNQPLFLVETE